MHEQYDEWLKGGDDAIADEEEEEADQAFAAETDLRNFLAKNLNCIEADLQLYQTIDHSGIEFPVDDGRIDILAIDRNDRFVVVELKVSKGRNKALGQLLYYMGWVDKKLGRGPCRGLIIAKEISDALVLAVQRAPGVSLARYKRVILRGRPNRTPRSLARLRPSPALARISSRSNSARTAEHGIRRPCGVVVSHQAPLERPEADALNAGGIQHATR